MKIHQINGYIQSIYLIEYPDGLMLLDGCCRADIDLVEHTITQQLRRPLSDLKLVVVTHMHPDHAGGADKLRQRCGCQIASVERPRHWYGGWDGALMHLTDIFLAGWVANRMGKPKRNLWYNAKLHPDIQLTDSQYLPGFPEWQVLETPGHTDRDISLLHTPSQKIYVADLMVKVKKRFIPPFPIFHPNQYRASLYRLLHLQPQAVWLAHGGEVQLTEHDYQHLLARAPHTPRTHWRATKAKLKRLLKWRH